VRIEENSNDDDDSYDGENKMGYGGKFFGKNDNISSV
jgi:hypothetical protein